MGDAANRRFQQVDQQDWDARFVYPEHLRVPSDVEGQLIDTGNGQSSVVAGDGTYYFIGP
jgi:hypothetical protein